MQVAAVSEQEQVSSYACKVDLPLVCMYMCVMLLLHRLRTQL